MNVRKYLKVSKIELEQITSYATCQLFSALHHSIDFAFVAPHLRTAETNEPENIIEIPDDNTVVEEAINRPEVEPVPEPIVENGAIIENGNDGNESDDEEVVDIMENLIGCLGTLVTNTRIWNKRVYKPTNRMEFSINDVQGSELSAGITRSLNEKCIITYQGDRPVVKTSRDNVAYLVKSSRKNSVSGTDQKDKKRVQIAVPAIAATAGGNEGQTNRRSQRLSQRPAVKYETYFHTGRK